MIWKIRALDWACAIFLASVAAVWFMGGGVSLKTMAGAAVGALIAGVLLHWQDMRVDR